MRRVVVFSVVLVMTMAVVAPAGARGPSFPDTIPLPDGFQPEGIAVGAGHTFYAGSLADGTVVAGDLRTGESQVLVSGEPGKLAVGMDVDARSGYLFVAGGPNGVGRVYDTSSAALLAEYPLLSGGPSGDFVNDVIVTRTAAYFTNSFAAELYRVPLGPGGALSDVSDVETIPLSGDWSQVPGFNANGIEASSNGTSLIVVNSSAASLYRVDPATGVASQIDLGGPLPSGDGLVLAGKTLYVVQNFLNQIGVITLTPDLAAGTVGAPITDDEFDIPTTAAKFGNSLYAVNARFGTPPTPETEYDIVKVATR